MPKLKKEDSSTAKDSVLAVRFSTTPVKTAKAEDKAGIPVRIR
jgi:hypothetical protein